MHIKALLLWYICILTCKLISSRNRSQLKIVRGKPTIIANYPSYARLYISLSRYRAMFCGSTYIRLHWLVTAAHCLEWNFGMTPKSPKIGKQNRIAIFMGLDNIQHALQKRRSERLIMHHNYVKYINTYNATYFDIGLIKIKIPFVTGTKVRCAAMARNVFVGAESIAIGYGAMEDGTEPYELQFIIVAITQIDKTVLVCSNVEGKNFCSGDSGGPMYLSKSKHLVGVITTTYGECIKGVGLYMNVPAFNSWIKTITRNHLMVRSDGGGGDTRTSAANSKSIHLELGILIFNMIHTIYIFYQ